MKKHAPIEQLREAAKEADKMLRERGIHTAESAIDRILAEAGVRLPGIPAYLPHRWTLQHARRCLRDIVVLWVEKNKGSEKKQENTKQFFKFLIKQLEDVEKETQRRVDNTPRLLHKMRDKNVPLHKVFSSVQQLETVQAMTRFMVDSFAVSIVVKEHYTTTQYVEWFMKWTLDLEAYWVKNEKRDGQPILGPHIEAKP